MASNDEDNNDLEAACSLFSALFEPDDRVEIGAGPGDGHGLQAGSRRRTSRPPGLRHSCVCLAHVTPRCTAFTCVETGVFTFAFFGSAERFTLIEGSRPLLWRRYDAKTATSKRAMRHLKQMET